ncbi:CAP-gly domain linker [Rhynchospora pubera]|uniref:CAP-gly domain linker n=1 Tax=Rhynchospora pubera TaxID=906938 RepID=A0AAV8DPY9_9POAL|nr:CAP-gly domain linker [Rhynchospora pubera]KAJ4768326.1 CAP-gly domain linker [Rhynchospora pubera]
MQMETAMEGSSAILLQISSLKDMLDQVNEEIEQNIQQTREIDSEIVKHSHVQKELLARECQLTKLVSLSEFELSGLLQLSGTEAASLELLETKIKLLKPNLVEIKRRSSDKMDKFTDECAQFQATVIEDSKEMASLVEEKEALEKEMLNLELKINMLQNSTTDYIAEILDEILRACSVLEAELKHGVTKYKSVLEDINNLKVIFANTIGDQNSSH